MVQEDTNMVEEEIIEHLSNGKTLVVNNLWYFTGWSMQCSEENCCDEQYNSYLEAADGVRYYARVSGSKIKVL